MGKQCSKCGKKKSIADFYKRAASKDGLRMQCKSCRLACQKTYYKAHRESRISYQETYRQTEHGKTVSKMAVAKYRRKYPDRHAARHAVSNALQTGRLKQLVFCESCGLPAKTEGHHSDYDRPLEVDWFCIPCHVEIHTS